MPIDEKDLDLLKKGEPPIHPDVLKAITIGQELWLDFFNEYHLYNFIYQGGSKVKVVVGSQGSGKTHLLRCIEQDSRDQGYTTVFFSLRDYQFKLNDLPTLYKTIVSHIDQEELIRGLCRKTASALGYDRSKYDGSERLLPQMVEDGMMQVTAEKEIRNTTSQVFKDADFGSSFSAFAYTVVKERMIRGQNSTLSTALRWLSGEKLERHERQSTYLFEKLQKSNARYWLNSLIRLLKLAGWNGLVVLIDDVDVITSRSPETAHYYYTPNAIKDVCEIIRQLIDDTELLNSFVLILSGRYPMLEDEKRGFKSYEALWMRLQSGLVSVNRFNPFADIVNMDDFLKALGDQLEPKLIAKINALFLSAGYERKFREALPVSSSISGFRAVVMENALLMNKKEGNGYGTL